MLDSLESSALSPPLPPISQHSATCEGWSVLYSMTTVGYLPGWQYTIYKPDGTVHREGKLAGDREKLIRDFRLIVSMNNWIIKPKPNKDQELTEQFLKDAVSLLSPDKEPPDSFQESAVKFGYKLNKTKTKWQLTKLA